MSDVTAAAPRDNVGRGILLTVFAVFVFALQDATTKLLVSHHSPFQITMIRYWAFAAFSLFLVTRRAPLKQAFRSARPRLQILRGLLLVADIWFFALSLQTAPLAELQAISLIYPLLVTLAAIPILGEKVGIFRVSAVVVGFLGAMVIVRPGGVPLNVGIIYGIASATCYAVYLVLTRLVSRDDPTPTSMVYAGTIGLVLTTAVGIFSWSNFDWQGMALMAFVMVTTCVAHGIMAYALSLAPASVLQPFNYSSLPWSIALSWLVFGHLIDTVSLIGAAIIVAAGLVVSFRERLKLRAAAGGGAEGRSETELPQQPG